MLVLIIPVLIQRVLNIDLCNNNLEHNRYLYLISHDKHIDNITKINLGFDSVQSIHGIENNYINAAL